MANPQNAKLPLPVSKAIERHARRAARKSIQVTQKSSQPPILFFAGKSYLLPG